MGRLRSSLARSEVDRELHRYLGDASRSLQRAMNLCAQAGRSRSNLDVTAAVSPSRARGYADTLNRALDLVGRVGYLAPLGDTQETAPVAAGRRSPAASRPTTLRPLMVPDGSDE